MRVTDDLIEVIDRFLTNGQYEPGRAAELARAAEGRIAEPLASEADRKAFRERLAKLRAYGRPPPPPGSSAV